MNEVLETLKNLSKYVASSDQSRVHLCGVNVESIDDTNGPKRIFVATDGHILAIIELESILEPGFYSTDTIKKMIALNDFENEIIKPVQMKYPDWKQFETKYDEKERRELNNDEKDVEKYSIISMNPILIHRLASGLGLTKRKGQGMIFIFHDKLSAVQVRCGDLTKRGVIMPMRM